MKETSLAKAKAHLSALVDQAEHHRNRIVILRHGKPAAAIVPVDATGGARRRTRLRVSEIRRVFVRLGAASPDTSAVADLLDGRR